MSYTPTEWATGDTITATALNKLETGVSDMSSGYTPYTWQTGDTITAARLNALEQGVAAGGGGSSEFSTATVTVHTASSGHYAQIYGAVQDISENIGYPTAITAITMADIEVENGDTYDVVLESGVTYATSSSTMTGSGDCSVETFSSFGDTVYLATITGDCTLTFS